MKRQLFVLTFCVLLTFALPGFGLGGWNDPPDGWDRLYEFDDLEGWVHNNGSDQWDESAPGEKGKSPGGAHIVKVPGEGDPSGDATVISIEDTGDPRNAGFADPGSNRKVYLENEVDFNGNFLIDGVTFVARWRINPDPIEAPADGYTMHDGGKGQVGIIHHAAPGNLSFSLDTGGVLYFGQDGAEQMLEIGDEFQFHTIWVTATLDNVDVYMDGDVEPIFSDAITFGNGSDNDIYPNYVTVGLGSTGRDGAIQVDYIGYKIGLYEPKPFAVNPAGKLPYLWSKLKMSVTSDQQ
jgi:hypothetical protein